MKIKTPVPFPANVAGTGGIKVSKANGVWTIEPDFSQLSAVLASAISNPTTKEIWLWDPVTGDYSVLTLAGLGDALYKLSSTTSLAIGTGSKTFITQSGKDIGVGSFVLATSDSGPSNFMLGQVTAYSGTSLTVSVTTIGGTGTKADWTIRAASPAGSLGISSGHAYLWSMDTTATDPGSGKIKANNATLSAATALFLSETDNNGNGLAAVIATWGASTSATKARVKLYNPVTPQNMAIFDVTAAVTDNGTWETLTVSYVASNGAFSNGDLLYASVSIVGDRGSTGAQGVNAGVNINFDATITMANPGTANLRLNNATIGSVTALAISANSADGGNPSISALVNTWDDSSTIAHRGTLTIRKASAPSTAWAQFDITGALTDNTTWLQIPISLLAGPGGFSAADALVVSFSRTGDAGAGSIAGATAHGVGIATASNSMTSTAAMTDGQLLIGQSAADPLPKSVSGDIMIDKNGVTSLSTALKTQPTIQRFTSGSGTYTKPANCLAIRVRMLGAGGGGGGTGSSGGSSGAAGGNTTFDTLTAGGGGGGGLGTTGAGSGAGAIGAPTGGNVLGLYGAPGGGGLQIAANGVGGNGGNSHFQGGGAGGLIGNGGTSAVANQGSGGGGGGGNGSTIFGGGGGGSGAYVEHIYTSPAASYSYSVGAGGAAGTAGTGGFAGGAGGSGIIIVEEYYK